MKKVTALVLDCLAGRAFSLFQLSQLNLDWAQIGADTAEEASS